MNIFFKYVIYFQYYSKVTPENICKQIFKKTELDEMGRLASTIAPKNVEEKIYNEIKQIIGEK